MKLKYFICNAICNAIYRRALCESLVYNCCAIYNCCNIEVH